MSVNPAAATTNAAAVAATAAVQALTDALHPAAFSQHKLFLPSFWLEDPVNWFQPYEVEFTQVCLPTNSYVCYILVIQALPSEVLTTIRDFTRDITTATPELNLKNKEALFSRFTALPLQECFKLLDYLPSAISALPLYSP
jgi:hypothetical protein